MKLNTLPGRLSFSDNSQLEADIACLYDSILLKYGYQDIIDKELEKRKANPNYGLEIVHNIDDTLFHCVRDEFLYNHGGVPRPNNDWNELFEIMRIRNNKTNTQIELTPLYNAKVEFYTGIMQLFQKYGGIPKQCAK
jgi:hypothetical protein